MSKLILPNRKSLRLENYDYSSNGAYFITICTNKCNISLWHNVGANCVRQQEYIKLSEIGTLINNEILKISYIYENVIIDKYCIMPDHIHMIIFLDDSNNTIGRTQFAPTISRIIKQFKGSITKQLGYPIWQKSFYDHIIRNEKAYLEIWRYIDENPLKFIDEKH